MLKKCGVIFTKMSGSGNDFIVIDNRKKIVRNASVFAKKYCHRKHGIGADGLLLVEKATRSITDFRMVYYNSDGSRASFCGNGARCIAIFAYLNKIATAKMTFDSDVGIIPAEIADADLAARYNVKVKMPAPKHFNMDFDIEVLGKTFKASFVDTGVPHAVIFMESLRKQGYNIEKIDVHNLGSAIRFHKKFQPAGTNVNFVKVIGKNKLHVRTYERGVEAETLACGTGIVASSIISVLKNYVSSPVSVLTQGGETLKVHLENVVQPSDGYFHDVFLEGKVVVIFEGKI